MSDTEVDGTPGGVEQQRQDTLVPYSPDERAPSGVLRGALIIVPLVLGLLVVAAIGARLLTAEIPDRKAATNERAPEVCWDGAPKPDDGCPIPSGRGGLRWVFPSFQPDEGDCRDAAGDLPRSTRPVMYVCTDTVDAGEVTILYSQLTQVSRGRASFEKLYGEPEVVDDELGRRLLWQETDDPGPDGDYDLAVMYASLPFAVELSADSAEALDEAFESVTLRDAADVMDHS